MNKPSLSPEDLMAMMSDVGGRTELRLIVAELETCLRDAQSFDALHLAATFGGLLTVPELQSNCLRLEALVHLTLAIGDGQSNPNRKIVGRLFAEAGKGRLGAKEDPAEDVFVTLIVTPRGDFRVLEGIWESAGFYLQRFVNFLELLPAGDVANELREPVYALLRLSDVVCQRAALARYQLGSDKRFEVLPASVLNTVSTWAEIVSFTEADFKEHGIALEHLVEFGFPADQRAMLPFETIGNSTLERFPIVHRDGEFCFLLPTAASAAIRRYITEIMESIDHREAFIGFLALEYGHLFGDIPLLGERRGAPIEFQRTEDSLLAGVTMEVDPGLFINVVFFVDPLKDFAQDGLIGEMPDLDKLSKDVKAWIESATDPACSSPGYRAGMTLLVGCGIGRGATRFPVPRLPKGWSFQAISAADLHTLCWLNDFNSLSMWRLLESERRLNELGVALFNMNGLLNLVGWSRSLDGHLVPHDDIPDEFAKDDLNGTIVVEQNALRGVRAAVLHFIDPHCAQTRDGRWLKLHKEGRSIFKEDNREPSYYAYDGRGSGDFPLTAYESPSHVWWCDLDMADKSARPFAQDRMRMLQMWLCRGVPVMERVLAGLPAGPLSLKCTFQGQPGNKEGIGNRARLTFEDAKAAITPSIDHANATVTLTVGPRFEEALFHPENIAERALVECLLESFAALAGQDLSDPERYALLGEIVPNVHARQAHVVLAARFRDFVRDSVWVAPVTIDEDDDAFLKLGLGWRLRKRAEGSNIVGKQACLSYLNPLVELLEDEICQELRQLDRRSVIGTVLLNHESAAADGDNWSRTAAAVLALHNDQVATRDTMTKREADRTTVFIASRILIEFAICECPLVGGRGMGKLDLSRLMAKIMMVHRLGGWSDAIRWDGMEPRLRITPLGDVHANFAFYDGILAPFARVASNLRVDDDVSSYAEGFEEVEAIPTDPNPWPAAFWQAWEEETGGTFDEMRKFLDIVEDNVLKTGRAIVSIKQSQLLGFFGGETAVSSLVARRIVENLTLASRSRWRAVPDGFDEKDRFPWRFRRRLSVLRRPLIQIDLSDDPTFVLAPGLVREAVVYMIGNYHRGDFPRWQLKPKMKSWAGSSRHKMGSAFAQKVAERLTELGWKTAVEKKVTEILRAGFDRDYGDVDVLAWNDATGRLLLCECKDLQYRKTEGEIAEQLSDYRGEIDDKGKRDDLRKHLDRIDLITGHLPKLQAYVSMSETPLVEGHLIFRNPVPMQFAWEQMRARTGLHTFADLDRI
ncbi:hypothetical protein [Bradyrhizobium sp. AUGA SZCCT0182]|uniref:hypothetical protein n=1 Tax=Bradyrhizobium sp. AUGA SZCCT0182 TaxID=2807667 RepID=UPI001BA44724|nr:hypothetical protein [Bradyrhizobium sp. AUGA SZCCT0182]MBR1231698.1 hypothetical protein [Bradyrhizobium sp. AUGA SZCCT0182]